MRLHSDSRPVTPPLPADDALYELPDDQVDRLEEIIERAPIKASISFWRARDAAVQGGRPGHLVSTGEGGWRYEPDMSEEVDEVDRVKYQFGWAKNQPPESLRAAPDVPESPECGRESCRCGPSDDDLAMLRMRVEDESGDGRLDGAPDATVARAMAALDRRMTEAGR